MVELDVWVILYGGRQNLEEMLLYIWEVPKVTCPPLALTHWIAFLNCFRICNSLVLAVLEPGIELRRTQQTSLASHINILSSVCYKWGSRCVYPEKLNGNLVEQTVQNSLYLYREMFDWCSLVKDNLDCSLCQWVTQCYRFEQVHYGFSFTFSFEK